MTSKARGSRKDQDKHKRKSWSDLQDCKRVERGGAKSSSCDQRSRDQKTCGGAIRDQESFTEVCEVKVLEKNEGMEEMFEVREKLNEERLS